MHIHMHTHSHEFIFFTPVFVRKRCISLPFYLKGTRVTQVLGLYILCL